MLYNPEPVSDWIELNDRAWNGTIVKQKGRVKKLEIDQPIGTCTAVLRVEVAMFGRNEDGSYGDEMTGQGITRYEKLLIADDHTACTPAGELRYILVTPRKALNFLTQAEEEFEPGQTFGQFLDAKPETYVLQGVLFRIMRDERDIRIADLQRANVLQGVAMGKYQ